MRDDQAVKAEEAVTSEKAIPERRRFLQAAALGGVAAAVVPALAAARTFDPTPRPHPNVFLRPIWMRRRSRICRLP